MTLKGFEALKGLQGRRVHMVFADGQDVIATLHSVTTDMDESQYLIYEKVEWSALPHLDKGAGAYYYSPGEELVRCSEVQV
jgi:hypothetical protein